MVDVLLEKLKNHTRILNRNVRKRCVNVVNIIYYTLNYKLFLLVKKYF